MKKTVLVILFMFLVSTVAISCQSKAEKLAKAKDLLNRRCSKCHFSDKIYKQKYSTEDWKNIIDRMIALSKTNPQREKIEISHEDAYEILLFLQEESGE
jgi:hypothetical protein